MKWRSLSSRKLHSCCRGHVPWEKSSGSGFIIFLWLIYYYIIRESLSRGSFGSFGYTPLRLPMFLWILIVCFPFPFILPCRLFPIPVYFSLHVYSLISPIPLPLYSPFSSIPLPIYSPFPSIHHYPLFSLAAYSPFPPRPRPRGGYTSDHPQHRLTTSNFGRQSNSPPDVQTEAKSTEES